MFREHDFEMPLKVESDEARQLREFAAAIRRGCIARPRQHYGWYTRGADAACALGAAKIGAQTDFLSRTFPALDVGLFVQIVYLNDERKWTREAIANWIDAKAQKL